MIFPGNLHNPAKKNLVYDLKVFTSGIYPLPVIPGECLVAFFPENVIMKSAVLSGEVAVPCTRNPL